MEFLYTRKAYIVHQFPEAITSCLQHYRIIFKPFEEDYFSVAYRFLFLLPVCNMALKSKYFPLFTRYFIDFSVFFPIYSSVSLPRPNYRQVNPPICYANINKFVISGVQCAFCYLWRPPMCYQGHEVCSNRSTLPIQIRSEHIFLI